MAKSLSESDSRVKRRLGCRIIAAVRAPGARHGASAEVRPSHSGADAKQENIRRRTSQKRASSPQILAYGDRDRASAAQPARLTRKALGRDVRTVVVAGASGTVGAAAVQAFLDAGWRVLALSRRAPPVDACERLHHLPLDLLDAQVCGTALRGFEVDALAYAAVSESPGLVSGWSDPVQMQANLHMLTSVLDPLATSGRLRHVSLLQGGKAYGAHLHPVAVPAREDGPRDPHDNFYWLQEDAVRASAARHGFRFTVLRPPVVVGGATGAAMNVLTPIALYAALGRPEGRPFGFPGGPARAFEMVDARVVAEALVWALDSPAAADQTFNVTNGDLADWRALWPGLARALGVAAGPDAPLSLARDLPGQADAWRALAGREGLVEPDLDALLGQSHHYADILFGYGMANPAPPLFLSTIKIRQAGFQACMDSAETFRFWIDDMVRRNLIPAPSAILTDGSIGAHPAARIRKGVQTLPDEIASPERI